MAQALNPTTNAKKVSFGAFSVSLVVHVALLLMISSVVIYQKAVPKVPFVGENMESSAAIEQTPPDILEEPPGPPSPDVDTGPPAPAQSTLPSVQAPTEYMTNVIQSSAPSMSFNVPTMGGSSLGKVGATGASGGGGAGTPGKTVAKLFGTTIEANHLGVMLDVSGSAHPFLDAAIEEIEKNFPDAVTVFVMGCGMKSGTKSEVLPYSKAKPDTKDKAGSRTTLGQIELAKQRNKEFERMTDRMSKRDNVFYVYGGDILATQYAFEKLMKENVDAIYWFADYEDAVEAAQAKEIAKDLHRAGIKLFAHNFAGKPIRAAVEEMVKETDGKSIVQAPKKK
jgi:hypothetical protein